MDSNVGVLSIVKEAIEKTAPGRPPAYSEAHVIKALEIIGSEGGIGRQLLSEKLRLGEGTTRTLVRRLRGSGLLGISRGGMTLTEWGHSALVELKKLMFAMEFPEMSITVESRNYAVLVRDASGSVDKGIEQRDAALIAGADGATTLVYDGEKLVMPGVMVEVDPAIAKHIVDAFKPGRGDVIIIGSARDPLDAEIGAKSAALKLLERMRDF